LKETLKMEMLDSAAALACSTPNAATSSSHADPSGTHCGLPSLIKMMVLSAVRSVSEASESWSMASASPAP
jgi:predicted secreted protein